MSTRVVVIDDDAEVCGLIAKMLVRCGHDVLVAYDGETGLKLLETHEAQCLVVDKQLPQMGGLEVIAEVRRRWPSMGIVLVTAHPEPFNLEAVRPDVVLGKPFKSVGAVDGAVREALEVHAGIRSPLTHLKERVAAVVAEITPGRRKKE